jgi:hypothetical protein
MQFNQQKVSAMTSTSTATTTSKSRTPILRWIATITYRTREGFQVKRHHIDEVSELHDLVEDGPNFYLMTSAVIEPNPAHFTAALINDALDQPD